MSTQYHKGTTATPSDILDKLKYRLPVFLLAIHCSVIQTLFGSSIWSSDESSWSIGKLITGGSKELPDNVKSKTSLFIAYYISINIVCMLWSFWHALRAYNEVANKQRYAFGFVICETITSFLLFIIVSNMASFSIPFKIMFGFDQTTTTIVCGIIIPIIYFLNSIEETYWKLMSDEYKVLEQNDDMTKDTNQSSGATDKSASYQSV
jgi:hypothetical protein